MKFHEGEISKESFPLIELKKILKNFNEKFF